MKASMLMECVRVAHHTFVAFPRIHRQLLQREMFAWLEMEQVIHKWLIPLNVTINVKKIKRFHFPRLLDAILNYLQPAGWRTHIYFASKTIFVIQYSSEISPTLMGDSWLSLRTEVKEDNYLMYDSLKVTDFQRCRTKFPWFLLYYWLIKSCFLLL